MGKKTKIGKDRKDKFYKLAKETGFRSRAAFKLIQLNRKFGFLQQSQVCIDLCAAPGGWMQVAKQNMPVSSIVIGVDLFPIKAVPGCISLIEDITTDKCRASLTKELKTWKADVILNDGAPNVGKSWIFDAYQQICLTLSAVKLATEFLRPGGWFVTKVFRSKDYNALIWVLKQLFKKVHATKPSASRKESAEIFVVCQYYKAPDKIDPKFFDPKHVFEELEIEPQIKINLLKETTSKKDKKAKPAGYDGTDVRKILPVSEFIAAENGLHLLAHTTQLVFDSPEIESHPATTEEIKECCQDIKVLGRKDLRELLKWWKTLHEHFYVKKSVDDTDEGVSAAPEPTEEEKDEAELDQVEKSIVEMQLEQDREAKRKKKKANKERTKLAEKLNLKMVIQGDAGPREEGDAMMFSLGNIKNRKELESLMDVEPDFVLEKKKHADDEFKPKFIKYDREGKGDLFDQDDVYVSDEDEGDSDADLEKTGEMAFDESKNGENSDEDEDGDDTKIERNRNPLITDLDYRSKGDKRLSKAKLWFEKESFKALQNDGEQEEDFDLDALAHDYENKGIEVTEAAKTPQKDPELMGKKAKRRARHMDENSSSSSDDSSSDDDETPDGPLEYETVEKIGGSDGFEVVSSEPKLKKVKLSEEELALGQMLVTSRKTRRDLTDAAWNRYMFNDTGLPEWFVKDEAETMKKGTPVPEELIHNYRKRVEEMNVRSIKKVIEAKSRKKRRGLKRLEKVKKKAESILENVDNTNQEKIRALKKYLAGRLNIISNTEAKGLGTFVGTFALPSLIFLSLAELNWSTVNWLFLLSILISKAIVFLAVGIISLLVVRPLNLGKAGLLAIFCTQSNDFAIGFPIVVALYGKSHPEYASYIYLLAPISLAILNPIGYVLMEITKMRNKRLEGSPPPTPVVRCPQTQENTENASNTGVRGKMVLVLRTVQNIFFNPVLSMTLLGVIGGVVFPNGLPVALGSVLRAFGNAFSGAALFLLGLRMVGKAKTFQGGGFILPGILIIVKLLVLPIVTRQTVNLMNAGVNFTDTTDLSTFGFLYGTFPAAPGVFVIASQYNQDVDLIASSMVASTFISAPLMFMSAKMIAIHNLSPSDYMAELDKFALEISIIAIVACIYLILLFITSRRIKRMPHRITACLVFSQLIECVGVILWSTLGQDSGWRMILQFCFFTIGGYSARLWTAILAISLLFLQCRSLCFVLKLWPVFVLVGWGVPTILVALLLIFDPNSNVPDKRNPSFQYGNAQAAISVFILVMCFIVIIGCLILHQRYKRIQERYLSLSKDVASDSEFSPNTSASTTNLIGNSNGGIPHVSSVANLPRRRRPSERNIETESSDDEVRLQNGNLIVKGCSGDGSGGCCSSQTTGAVLDIEDLLAKTGSINNDPDAIETDNKLCPSQYNCAGPSRQNCKSLVEKYHEQVRDGLEPLEIDMSVDTLQTMKHIVLLILLLCSMFVGLAISVWTLVMEGMSGIYVEITFLDAFLNFGQSLMVLAVFITDSGELFSPILAQWRKLWYGANILKLPGWDQLSPETRHICEQFTKHHLEHCRREIAKDRRWRIQVYKKVFYGRAFVDWLIEVGLAKDRTDALNYGKALVEGRVLRHINNVHHFHDKNLLYTFCARF